MCNLLPMSLRKCSLSAFILIRAEKPTAPSRSYPDLIVLAAYRNPRLRESEPQDRLWFAPPALETLC